MKLLDIGKFGLQDVGGQEPVVEAVAALALKFQARTGQHRVQPTLLRFASQRG